MLIPQFTIRWLLALTAVCALLSLIVARAIAGSGWAVGISAALVALVGIVLVHLLFYAGIWLIGYLFPVVSGDKLRSQREWQQANARTISK